MNTHVADASAPTDLRQDKRRPAKSNAQFVQNPMVRLARAVMPGIDRVAPRIAARLTHRMISSPPRHRMHASESGLSQQAQRWRLPFQGGWLQCYRWGAGPLCLYVHCWGGRGTQAAKLIERLCDSGMSVVSFDHPAHGLSSGSRTEMMAMAAATATVMHHLGNVQTVIGHSLGVAAAAIALRDFELSVNRLVSVSSLTHCTWFTDVIGDYLGISRTTVQRARDILSNSYADPVHWDSLSVPSVLATLTCPVLLIHDRDDREIPFEHAQTIKQAVPRAEFHSTSGLGHRRILREPHVVQLISHFAKLGVSQ